MRKTVFATLLAASLTGLPAAADMIPDPTGDWYSPLENGWGLSLAQQGDTVFAALLVYAADGKPTWYVATGLRPPVDFAPGQPVPNMVGGTLYRATGPWFGGAFDPKAVSVAPVGTMTLQYASDLLSITVNYTIDGTIVSKSVYPLSWGSNARLLPGAYEGGMVMTTKSPDGTCPPVSYGPIDASRAFRLTIAAGARPDDVRIVWGTGIDTACTITGNYMQMGQLGNVFGTLSCGPVGSPPANYPIRLSELAVGPHGFAGLASWGVGGCNYTGHIGGVRQP